MSRTMVSIQETAEFLGVSAQPLRRWEREGKLIPDENLQWERLSGCEDDGIVQMKVSPQARRKNPALPETWTARAIRVEGTERILLTSLTDPQLSRTEADHARGRADLAQSPA